MPRQVRLCLALFALLGLAAGALAQRVARRLEQGGALRLELGRVRPTQLSRATLERFGRLKERVLATYYVSPPERMPSGLRRLELEVTDLLAALRARFPQRFDFQVVDPESGEGLTGFAARRKVAPFKVRSVTRDAWDERTVWSTLALSSGARPEALLHGLAPEHLPYLQEWLVGWLDELAQPRAPRIVLATPAEAALDLAAPGFEELADALTAHGQVARVDLDAGEGVPDADLLLWLRPRRVSGEQLRALERLLSSGASVVIAGGLLEPHEEVRADVPYVSFRRPESALDELAAHFGLGLEPGLVLDTTCEELEFGAQKLATPHWIRSIAPDQDFQHFAAQPNGTLLFRAPSAFVPRPARLAEIGWTAEVLATTSDGTWLVPDPPAEPDLLTSLVRTESQAVAKQALLVALRHHDPWHGLLVFAAAETPFADGFFRREHAAHARLLEVLLDETTSSERLVLSGIEREQPAPLPPFTPAVRLAWRAFGIALPVLILLWLHGRAFGRTVLGLARRSARGLRAAALPGAALLVALVLARGARALDFAIDLTPEGWNDLAPAARAIAGRAGAAGEIEATLFLSEPERLPPAMRAPARALANELATFERAGANLALQRVVPEDLSAAERAALEARGIASEAGATSDDGVTRVARFTCALRLTRDGREVVLAFPSARSFERLEFRLALALERLAGRAPPRVAFASDVPRLSAAEAFEQYQQKGLFAPRGTDVFALARAALAQNDLEVTHVNPRAPVMPQHVDVLVWLQPRRSIEPMLEETVRHLHGGGRVVLAAQHFELRTQQFRGGDFELQYWPQPQNPDLELLYFPELGIELVREVLFDALSVPIAADSQVTGRGAARDFERQASALPFQIRLSAAGYADHALMRGLGDQAFLWANRIRWDTARLVELGLTATPLAFSSQRTWSYAWKGGWVPHALLSGPAALAGSSGEYLGPQPFAVLFEGAFPRPKAPLCLAPADEAAEAVETAETAPAERPWPASAPGRLVLIGDAQFLENDSLASAEFRGDQLLWNAVANLAFEGELLELATRARTPRGFGLVEPRARLVWRAGVIAAGPLLVVLGAVGLAAVRRRPAKTAEKRARA